MKSIVSNFLSFLIAIVLSSILSAAVLFYYLDYRSRIYDSEVKQGRFSEKSGVDTLSQYYPTIQVLPFRSVTMHLKWLNNDSFAVNMDSANPHTMFINVWETWCRPCVEEFPSLERLVSDYKGSKTAFYFISSENVEKLKKFKEVKGFKLPFYSLDRKTNIKSGSPLHSNSIPFTLIVVPKKKLMVRINGAVDWDDPNLRAALSCYLQ
jgi:thiol-disulfide isomerase/thioredoxin